MYRKWHIQYIAIARECMGKIYEKMCKLTTSIVIDCRFESLVVKNVRIISKIVLKNCYIRRT